MSMKAHILVYFLYRIKIMQNKTSQIGFNILSSQSTTLFILFGFFLISQKQISLELLQQKKMDDTREQQEDSPEISVKRPFIGKFFKQLNHYQTQKMRKSKRKQKLYASITEERLEKFEKLGFPLEHKSSKRLQEMNHNGNRILASFKNDQINGQAQIHYNNGVVFKGIYQNGIKIKGHFKFLNGYEYIGNCLGNKFFGEGCLIFPSGKIISGQWKEYAILGNGKIEYPQGEVYFGEIENFKKHGKGYLFFSDGSKYIGQFEKGMISGTGTYFVDDKPLSKGQWENGELVKADDSQEINEQNINVNIDEMQSRVQNQKKQAKDKIRQKSNNKQRRKSGKSPSMKQEKPQKENSTSLTDYLNIQSQVSSKNNKKVRFG